MGAGICDLLATIILKRSWFRSDRFWTNALTYRRPFIDIPFYMDRWALKRSQYWTRTQLDDLTDSRLERMLSAAAAIPLWRDTFMHIPRGARSAREYLTQLPVITRATFKELPPEQYLNSAYLNGCLRDTTSGSTGFPFTYYMDRATLLSLKGIRDREFTAAARGTPYPSILLRADRRVHERFFNGHFVFLRSYNDLPERYQSLKGTIAQHAPDGAVLYTFASTAVALAAHVRDMKDRLPLKAVVAVGESISAENRALIEDALHTHFSLTYATLESSSIAFECEAGNAHINEESLFIEVLDDTGARVPDGTQGRIVISHLGYRLMPLIRYGNGDTGIISVTACPCGRSLKTISIAGRTPALIEQKDGYTVTLTELSSSLNAWPAALRAYQIVHHSPEDLTIRIIPGERYEELREGIEGRVLRKLHPSTKVRFELVNDIPAAPSGKARYYVREF